MKFHYPNPNDLEIRYYFLKYLFRFNYFSFVFIVSPQTRSFIGTLVFRSISKHKRVYKL